MLDSRVYTRRMMLGVAMGGSLLLREGQLLPSATTRSSSPPLAPRLDARSLTPLSAFGLSSRNGDVRYPSWLEGTWRARNTIDGFSMPLGSAFVDTFTRAIAEEDVAIQEPLHYSLRYVLAPSGNDEIESVAQDRRFNAVEETNAFLGPDGGTVRQCVYECCGPMAPHGRLVIEVADAADKDGGSGGGGGGTRIELLIMWVQWGAASSGAFVTSELVRQRVTRSPDAYEASAQDETTFLEILTRFEPERFAGGRPASQASAPQRVRVRNRIANYLSLDGLGDSGLAPQLARETEREARMTLAAGRAVSFFDYDWMLVRAGDGLGTGQMV